MPHLRDTSYSKKLIENIIKYKTYNMDLRGAVSLCTRLCKQKIKKAMQLKGNVE